MKKILSMLLVFVLIMGAFGACTKSKEEEKVSGDNKAPTTKVEETSNTDTKEVVTLKIVIKDVSPEEEIYQTWLLKVNEGLQEAGIGAKLELVSLQSGTYSENLALYLNSGEIPDIIYFQGGDQEFALTQGILEDLTSYIQNSTYVKGLMQDYMFTRLENYPYLLYLTALSTKVPVIRTDIFSDTKTGNTVLENPTIDNYYAFMKELKEKGFKSAWTTAGNLTEINNAFDQAFGLSTTWVKGDDGKYEYGRVSKFGLEELKFYAKLYSEGLLDNEYTSNNWESKENKFYNNEVAIVSGTQGGVIQVYETNQVKANGEGASLTVLPPASGIAQGYTPVDVSKESRGFAISALSEHKDLAFQVFEWAASPEGTVLDLLGIEGVHYNVVDGKYVLTEAASSWYPLLHGSLVQFDMSQISEETPYYSKSALSSLDMFRNYSTQDNAFVIPDEYAITWDGCESLYKEFAADFVMGNKTEADWDTFVTNWNAAGGAKVVEYANTSIK